MLPGLDVGLLGWILIILVIPSVSEDLAPNVSKVYEVFGGASTLSVQCVRCMNQTSARARVQASVASIYDLTLACNHHYTQRHAFMWWQIGAFTYVVKL